MSGNYLLDTNIVIHLFGRDEAIESRIRSLDSVFLPFIVLGELYYGAYQSQKVVENIAKISGFLKQVELIFPDADTCNEFGFLKASLKKIGKPIPEHDIWVAALAKQHHLRLASRDRHYSYIKDISWEVW
jgi:tRNA(fMet)-specific endonuclease VapC